MRYTGELPVYMTIKDQIMELDSAILYDVDKKHYTTLISKATHWYLKYNYYSRKYFFFS